MKIIVVFCCLLYASRTEAEDIHMDGFEGGEVTFLCSHKFAKNNHKYFCKDPCKDKDVLATVESGTRVESKRMTLVDSGDGAFTVTFHQLRLSDSGKYWCAVDRSLFHTFTAVYLTVKEVLSTAAVNTTVTVVPELPSTRTSLHISSSTPAMDTSQPAKLSAASNFTEGVDQNTGTGALVYATVGAAAMLTVLMLCKCLCLCRKHRENSKPQPQLCSNSTDLTSADKREQVDSEYDDIDVEVQSTKNISEELSCTHLPKQDPSTSVSRAAGCSAPLHVYENINFSKSPAHSRYDVGSGIYIIPLPSSVPETAGNASLGKLKNQPAEAGNVTKPAQSSESSGSTDPSRGCSDSTETGPKSTWFGLDLSGTI